MLIYVHISYSRHPVNCLDHLKDDPDVWPVRGILRVEIVSGGEKEGYSVKDSYEKERKMLMRSRQQQDELSILFQAFSSQGSVSLIYIL